MDRMSAAAEFEDKFVDCDKSLCSFVMWAQCHGLLSKRASRGKTHGGGGESG